MKKIALILCLLVGIIAIGCVPLSHYLTPSDLDQRAIDYVIDAGVADANSYKGYKNLHKANLLVDDIDKAYKLNQFDLQKAAEKNDLDYSICVNAQIAFRDAAVLREESLFGEEGGLATILGIAGLSGATGLLGLMRKRSQDWTKEEVDVALAEVSGKTKEEIAAKTKAISEVVKSVDKFKELLNKQFESDSNATVKVADLLIDLKNTLNSVQDSATKLEVSKAKVIS